MCTDSVFPFSRVKKVEAIFSTSLKIQRRYGILYFIFAEGLVTRTILNIAHSKRGEIN